MAKTSGDSLYTDKSKMIGKTQFYGLVTDTDGDPIINEDTGNEELETVKLVNGRVQTDSKTADGDNGTLGSKNDLVVTDPDLEATVISILKGILSKTGETEITADSINLNTDGLETLLGLILAKLIATPSTEAKQDTLIAKDFATQATLAAILAKLIAAPATEAKQDTLIGKDFATQATLAAIAALIGEAQASPSENTILDRLKDLLTGIVLNTGSNVVGKIGLVNAAGDRQVFVQANLGDEEDFVNALATSAFMLQYDPITSKYKRFNGGVTINGSLANKTVIANAVAITDDSAHTYNIIDHGSMTEAQIRQYKNFKISLHSTHDQAAIVSIYVPVLAFGPTSVATAGTIYSEAGVLTANNQLIIAATAGGTGSVNKYKVVPALADVISNLLVVVQFTVAPTAGGALTIIVEMN